MKRFFDSSVLVAAHYGAHPFHRESLASLYRADVSDYCSVRSLAEAYSSLTGLPIRPRISPSDAITVVGRLVATFTVVSLSPDDYQAAINLAATCGVTGGAVYDALIAQSALKVGAAVLLTWNVRDFIRFGPSVAAIVKTPLQE